jgi:hypothetical protein
MLCRDTRPRSSEAVPFWVPFKAAVAPLMTCSDAESFTIAVKLYCAKHETDSAKERSSRVNLIKD